MNILFSFVSLPHLSSSGVFTDLIKEFAKQGHNVTVVVPMHKGMIEGLNKEEGIDVIRFKTDQLTLNKSNLKKGLAYLKFPFQCLSAINRYFKKERIDLIFTHSLPPEMSFVVQKLKWKYKAKHYLYMCEYIWQDAVSLGFFTEQSLFCRYYKWLENEIIKQADFIGCPSQGNIDFLLKYHPWASQKNIKVLHYSEAPIELYLDKDNNFLKTKYNIEDKFVAVYGGNVSIAQKIENVLYLAESCIDYPKIIFLLIGRGSEILKIKEIVKLKGMHNVKFIDFMPKVEYLQLLSICDVGLISLNEKLVMPNIPSKTLSYFNLSLPVVASIDRNTDYGQYLDIAGAGLWSYAGDTSKFKENVLTFFKDTQLKKKMGINGFQFYLKNMLPERAYTTIIDQINNQL